jgi:small-conductance mechanosensitive channel
MEVLNQIIDFRLLEIGNYFLTIKEVMVFFGVILATKIILWSIKKVMFQEKNIDLFQEGTLQSLFQIIKYFLWIISTLIVLDTFGLKLNVILAGSAALLVGVGLGLQNTFNDFISGIILLFEGSIRVGDILEIENKVVKIQRIGLRTSAAINRDDIIIILPNSLITTAKVINWSHQSKKTRFKIAVGVSYDSDIEKVSSLLKDSVLEHPEIKDKKSISVRLVNFGASSLNFELLFFSRNIFRIENLKSDIRKIIFKKFKENNIRIPFPQMDVHIKAAKQE